MSGVVDLSGIAARAYTPGAKPAQPARVKSGTSEDNKSLRPAVTDRRLAPAFSIELSLAAQQVLNKTVEQPSPLTAGKAPLQASREKAQTSSPFTHFSEGVGRREAPLAGDRRAVALGSQLNIEI